MFLHSFWLSSAVSITACSLVPSWKKSDEKSVW